MSFSAPSPPDSSSSSSSQRNSAHTSPQIPPADLGVDPSDPFNLLMHPFHNSDSSMDDSSGETPPDWSQLSSFWPTSNFDSTFGEKSFTDMDFNMGLSSDFDFVSSMGIDPNALQFDNQTQKMGYNFQDFNPNNLLPTSQSLPFTFQAGSPGSVTSSNDSSQHQRRLSVTSTSSSSGASLSPVAESRSPSVQAQEQNLPLSADSAAEELAQRVRQSAGVMWAVPMNQPTAVNAIPPNYPTQPGSSSSPIPIPASSPNNTFLSSGSSISSAASTPPPSTPPPHTYTENPQIIDKLPMSDVISTTYPVSGSGPGTGSGASISILSRPKTSHTTIERRYRTNLNARIMSLRMAVPALRVLEDREGTGIGGGGKKTKGKNATLGKNVVFGSKVQVKKEGEDGEDVVDVIDERGFVDGVKVARKCSKANVLGKAVEYIRVLKKRELRLKREQEGLKSLINGLVGGPALLREWEREWKDRFGGEEKDEVEGEDMQDDGSDDDAGSGDEDEEDEGNSRKRKKPKVAPLPLAKKEPKEKKPAPPPPQPQIMPDGSVIVPEKRKRGRPRKVVPPPVTAAAGPTAAVSGGIGFPSQVMQGGDQTMFVQPQPAQSVQQQSQPAQYLLATFALFSFFNNPFSSSSSSHPPPNHTHTGTVVSHGHDRGGGHVPTAPIILNFGEAWAGNWQWHDVIQAFHFLVSALVFMSIVLPWLPIPSKYFSLSYLSSSLKAYRTRLASTSSAPKSAPANPRSRSASLVAALSPSKRGTEDEVACIRSALGGSGVFAMLSMPKRSGLSSKGNIGFEQRGLEQRAWVRVGEICVLGDEPSTLTRALTWWHMRSHLSWFTASAADLSTLALVAWPLGRIARRHSRGVWDAARARKTLNHNLSSMNGGRDGGVNVQARAHERLVLESMGVDEAIERLKERKMGKAKENEAELIKYSPIGVLAWTLVRKKVKRHLRVMFVKAVLPKESESLFVEDGADIKSESKNAYADEKEDDERRRTIEAARSLGGKMADLGDILQKVGTMGVWELGDLATFSEQEERERERDQDGNEQSCLSLDTEIKVLLNALILYRQIFSSSILESAGCGGPGVSILLSPPPSPGSRDVKLHLALRRVLGSSVFDYNSEDGDDVVLAEALEDARDRVVDMLVELERAAR